jgi:hypothetical protein
MSAFNGFLSILVGSLTGTIAQKSPKIQAFSTIGAPGAHGTSLAHVSVELFPGGGRPCHRMPR